MAASDSRPGLPEPRIHSDSDIRFIDDILGSWKDVIGKDFPGYRNHAIRVAGFCFLLHPCDEIAKRKILIAACFHDIGIWSERTFDYLDPSVRQAEAYLRRNDLQAWSHEIGAMISGHHSLRRLDGEAATLIETFRRADLVDLSLGLVKFGIPGSEVRKLRTAYPNFGFHRTLLALAAARFMRRPLDPFPMVKW